MTADGVYVSNGPDRVASDTPDLLEAVAEVPLRRFPAVTIPVE